MTIRQSNDKSEVTKTDSSDSCKRHIYTKKTARKNQEGGCFYVKIGGTIYSIGIVVPADDITIPP